jgi:sodium transport system permease protein
MRPRTVRLIWQRELTDLLRDRRWLFMLLGLPVLLYPAFGLVGVAFAIVTLDREYVVGIAGAEHLPPRPPSGAVVGPAAELTWLAVTPTAGAPSVGDFAAAAGTYAIRRTHTADPPLLDGDRFAAEFRDELGALSALRVKRLDSADRAPLDAKDVDTLVVVPDDFADRLARGDRPTVEVLSRDGDDVSKLAARRVTGVLGQYRRALKLARFARAGLPADFDQPFAVRDPYEGRPALERETVELRDLLARFVPFMLVMWSLAGALYPAIDLCAGEKERGTMETLLISPADRGEIVAGKFLAVWSLAAVTALWNLVWMGGGAWLGGELLNLRPPLVSPAGLFWCAVFVLPLAALFSALCLALGVYARSTKEGQYYLLPIFLATMPLVTLSLTPGMELSLLTSVIPVTNVCLLLQQLMRPAADGAVWLYVPSLVASLAACVGLALWWAVNQFHREDVLFREADRLDVGTWLRTAFRPRQRPTRG